MKTGWKTAVVVMVVIALVGGVATAGQGGGPGWGRGPAHAWGPGMGPGMGMGFGPRAGGPMGPGMCGLCPLGPGQGNALGAIGARLDLTDEQKTQIREIHEQAKTDAEAAQKAVADAREALHDAVTSGAAEADIRAAAALVGEAIGNQAVLHAKTVAAVKAVLTDEQQKEFEELKATRPGLRRGAAYGQGPMRPWGGPGGRQQAGRPRMSRPGFGGGPLPLEEMFGAADADKDGKLTLEELQAFRDSRRGAPETEDE